MHLVKLHRRFRLDSRGVESPIEDLFAFMIVVVIIVMFVSSLSTIYGLKADQDRRSNLWDRCMSFSTTILNHPMLLEDTFSEEGLFSGAKLLVLRNSYERQTAGTPGGTDGNGAPSSGDGEEDPFTEFYKSLNSGVEFGWELYFQDISDYPSRPALTFSLRSGEATAFELQSLVWSVNIFLDVDEIHTARLTVLVMEV